MIRVKVCGMHDPLNIKEIAEVKPDFMGFIFYPGSPRYVGDEPETELFRNVASHIKKTGVFLNENNHKILDISIRTGLDIIQLHGNESPASCFQLKSSGLTIITVSYTHLRAHETRHDLVCRLLLEKKKKK